MDGALYLLVGKTRACVLLTLHEAAREDAPLHLREIARRAAVSPTAAQYELRLLAQLDMVRDVGTAVRPRYVLNREHGLFPGLHEMFTRQEKATLLPDDPHFRQKRIQQQRDRRATSRDNSPFLRQWGTLAGKVKVS